MSALFIKATVVLALLVAGGLAGRDRPVSGSAVLDLVFVLLLLALAGFGLYLL